VLSTEVGDSCSLHCDHRVPQDSTPELLLAAWQCLLLLAALLLSSIDIPM
jgi:hypothetical protein